MRALAAVITVALCSGLRALEPPAPRDALSRTIHAALGISEGSPANKLIACSRSLGPTKCFSALSIWRAERALEGFENGRAVQDNLREDVEQFPWMKYSNSSDEQLYSQLTEDTERLLKYRSLSLIVPGYSLALESKGNGTLNVDIIKNEPGSERGMKKLQKEFYNILPLLMIPGLIMSAILPFVLPALKMTTVAVGMLNNMALSGAVFTLLRNNAFNDHYEKKVIYVNEGYKNEKFSPLYYKRAPLDHFEVDFAASNVQPVAQPLEQPIQGQYPGENFDAVQDAMNNDWINQYYGGDGFNNGNGFSNMNMNVNSLNGGDFGIANNVNGGNNSPVVSPSSINNIIAAITGAPPPVQTKVRRSSKIKQSPNQA